MRATLPKRLNYKQCRTPVMPPSDWDTSNIPRSARLPEHPPAKHCGACQEVGDPAELELEHVHGYRGDHPSQNLHVGAGGVFVWYAAGHGICWSTARTGLTCLPAYLPTAGTLRPWHLVEHC